MSINKKNHINIKSSLLNKTLHFSEITYHACPRILKKLIRWNKWFHPPEYRLYTSHFHWKYRLVFQKMFYRFYKKLSTLTGTRDKKYVGAAPLVVRLTPVSMLCTVINYDTDIFFIFLNRSNYHPQMLIEVSYGS